MLCWREKQNGEPIKGQVEKLPTPTHHAGQHKASGRHFRGMNQTNIPVGRRSNDPTQHNTIRNRSWWETMECEDKIHFFSLQKWLNHEYELARIFWINPRQHALTTPVKRDRVRQGMRLGFWTEDQNVGCSFGPRFGASFDGLGTTSGVDTTAAMVECDWTLILEEKNCSGSRGVVGPHSLVVLSRPRP